MTRLALALMAGLVATLSVTAPTAAQELVGFPPLMPHSDIISPPPGGAGTISADGPSDNTAISQDNRNVRLVAFDSAADNLVSGDRNGKRDVFVLRKTRGPGNTGGVLALVSVSTTGRQGNGDSVRPSIDGTTGWVPRCVAFESDATNLDSRDRSADFDVFVRNLRRRTTELVSVGQPNAHDASIDGRCRYIAFDAGHHVYVRDLRLRRSLRVTDGRDPDLQTDGRGVVYQRGGQVYYQALRAVAGRLGKRGAEVLISDTRLGQPGNGVSSNAVVDDHGRYVAFQSTATDLCDARCVFPQSPYYKPGWVDPSKAPSGDANGPLSDIFRRRLDTGPRDPYSMQLVSYAWNYEQANAPSYNPAITRAGEEVLFESAATNVGVPPTLSLAFPGTHGFTNVFAWYDSGVHRPSAGIMNVWWSLQPGGWLLWDYNGASVHPSISSRGNYVAFTSTEVGHGGESNGPAIPDVFLEWVGGSTDGLPTG